MRTPDSIHRPEHPCRRVRETEVEPAPTNSPKAIARQQEWIEETFSTPAWNHVVFTNQPQLLYGDYLISNTGNDDFLGTTLHFGSDEFKTWEEIITFFERLGGQ